MLNMTAVEVARHRADQAAAHRRRDDQIAQARADHRPQIDAHRARLAAATGLHRVLIGWHEPKMRPHSTELLCEHCDDSVDDYYGAHVEWPCPTYEAVLANPEGSCP